MSRSIMLLCLASALGACQTNGSADQASRGVASVNVPVVARSDYAFDLAAPDGALGVSEEARLDAWFRSLELGYGDTIYVDGPYAYDARRDVARIAGNYGLIVASGAPVSAGPVPAGMVRVVVARTRASMPTCPNWENPYPANIDHEQMPNFGCGVNANFAAQVANPQDLVHGRAGPTASDGATGAKAVLMYRDWPLTAIQPGQDLRPLLANRTRKEVK